MYPSTKRLRQKRVFWLSTKFTSQLALNSTAFFISPLRYNDSFLFSGHQMMTVDKQEGVYAGGKAEYTGVRTFEVYSDFAKGEGCDRK